MYYYYVRMPTQEWTSRLACGHPTNATDNGLRESCRKPSGNCVIYDDRIVNVNITHYNIIITTRQTLRSVQKVNWLGVTKKS